MLSVITLLMSCAQSVPIPDVGIQYNFLYGVWHGFISPISFLISLFDSSVQIYGSNNSGSLYNLGFVLGSGTLLGGSVSVVSKRK